MAKVIKGSKDRKAYQVIKGPSDTRQIRCPKCKETASQTPDGKGGFLCTCPGCGAKFSFAKM